MKPVNRHDDPQPPLDGPSSDNGPQAAPSQRLRPIAAAEPPPEPDAAEDGFQYLVERFADVNIVRYEVPGFAELSLRQKRLLYYLSMAALAGRDMIYDQNYKHNLCIRKTLEAIVGTCSGDRRGRDWDELMVYVKRVWFANGIHHHASTRKFQPGFSAEYFSELLRGSDATALPLREGETVAGFAARLIPVLFDPDLDAVRVNKDPLADPISDSANHYYEGATRAEVEAYYAAGIDSTDPEPSSHGLNSRLVKEDGKLVEKVWKVGGLYSEAVEQITSWLEKAVTVADTPQQATALGLLTEFYRTGDLKTFNEYNVAWVQDTDSQVDVINGFIEVYGDALGYRGSFESVVAVQDLEATARVAAISRQAQWFEDHSPIMDEHKKEAVRGVSAKVIAVVAAGGDASPQTPIGINLPNANWIRQRYGSKSVSLGNLEHAYGEVRRTSGLVEEFAYSPEEIELYARYELLADHLSTHLHEVIGHGSGRLEPGVATPQETLKQYASTVEESRADLVALYFLMDEKLIEIGVMESVDVARTAYNGYIENALLRQLRRLEPGEDLEEDHMRNRQLVAGWVYELGKTDQVIEKKRKGGKTCFVINDYQSLRELFGRLLREVQRIKSQGDHQAAKELVESYGVKVDPELHAEVLERVKKYDIAPYSGCINPRLIPVFEGTEIVDVVIEYPTDFTEQQLEYSREHSFLPVDH
ncbi:MAG: dihydrofolate reductase [bacterium]|nr:dihydrofolate reductase [bacterium]